MIAKVRRQPMAAGWALRPAPQPPTHNCCNTQNPRLRRSTTVSRARRVPDRRPAKHSGLLDMFGGAMSSTTSPFKMYEVRNDGFIINFARWARSGSKNQKTMPPKTGALARRRTDEGDDPPGRHAPLNLGLNDENQQ